jgi:mannose-1-phosphate guanylyltransferase
VGFATDDIGWNDVGSWNAVYELLPRDKANNVARSETLAHDSTGNYIDANGKLVALLGVKDLVVVDTPEALLIADRSRAQEVGELVKMLEKQKRDDLL